MSKCGFNVGRFFTFDDEHRLKNKYSGLCLSALSGLTRDSTVIQDDCSKGVSFLEKTGSGLQAAGTDLCLDRPNGSVDAPLQFWDCSGSTDTQNFDVITDTSRWAGPCPESGKITWSFDAAHSDPDEGGAYARISEAMGQAVAMYNCYTPLIKTIRTRYTTSVGTADGGATSPALTATIRFGPNPYQQQQFVAMHELTHTLGVDSPAYRAHIVYGIFYGSYATAEAQFLTGDPNAIVKTVLNNPGHLADYQFLPYWEGIAFTDDYGVANCRIVTAIAHDLNFPPFGPAAGDRADGDHLDPPAVE
jgi:hypothetical protein